MRIRLLAGASCSQHVLLLPDCRCPLVDLNLGKVIHVDMYDEPARMPPMLVRTCSRKSSNKSSAGSASSTSNDRSAQLDALGAAAVHLAYLCIGGISAMQQLHGMVTILLQAMARLRCVPCLLLLLLLLSAPCR